MCALYDFTQYDTMRGFASAHRGKFLRLKHAVAVGVGKLEQTREVPLQHLRGDIRRIGHGATDQIPGLLILGFGGIPVVVLGWQWPRHGCSTLLPERETHDQLVFSLPGGGGCVIEGTQVSLSRTLAPGKNSVNMVDWK